MAALSTTTRRRSLPSRTVCVVWLSTLEWAAVVESSAAGPMTISNGLTVPGAEWHGEHGEQPETGGHGQ